LANYIFTGCEYAAASCAFVDVCNYTEDEWSGSSSLFGVLLLVVAFLTTAAAAVVSGTLPGVL